MANQHTGTVAQILGPVLDIRFADGQLPNLLNAIEIRQGDKTLVCEVAQHIGDNVARCIAMGSTDGLQRGIDAVDTGSPSPSPWARAAWAASSTCWASPWTTSPPPRPRSVGPFTAMPLL